MWRKKISDFHSINNNDHFVMSESLLLTSQKRSHKWCARWVYCMPLDVVLRSTYERCLNLNINNVQVHLHFTRLSTTSQPRKEIESHSVAINASIRWMEINNSNLLLFLFFNRHLIRCEERFELICIGHHFAVTAVLVVAVVRIYTKTTT